MNTKKINTFINVYLYLVSYRPDWVNNWSENADSITTDSCLVAGDRQGADKGQCTAVCMVDIQIDPVTHITRLTWQQCQNTYTLLTAATVHQNAKQLLHLVA